MAGVKVLGGSFPKHTCQYRFGQISLWDGKGANWGTKTISVAREFESIVEITEENRVALAGAAGWGTVGAVLAGPIGLAVGAVLGGRGKSVTFAAKLKNGKQLVGQTSAKIFGKMVADVMTGSSKR